MAALRAVLARTQTGRALLFTEWLKGWRTSRSLMTTCQLVGYHVAEKGDTHCGICGEEFSPAGPVHEVDAGAYYAELVDGVPMIFRADTRGAVLGVGEAQTCTFEAGHDGPCCGYPAEGCLVWDDALGYATPRG